MDDVILDVDPKKCLKTYQKPIKTNNNANDVSEPIIMQLPKVDRVQKSKDLTTKEAVEFLLEGTLKSKVCRYCLKISSQLSYLDTIINVAGKRAMYKVAIKDIIASFHPFKVADDPNFPDRICDNCLDRAIASYLFTQQCEQAERALKNCFEDMFDKLEKLDPLERKKQRGRHKIHPNHNVLHAEHEKVIEYAEPIIHIVNTSSEVFTEQTPISELECLKCCEILPDIESLINHTTTHPKTMWYNCRLCGLSFPKKHKLKKHFNTKHGLKQPQKQIETTRYECNTCTVTFEKYYEYMQHIEKHKFKVVMEHLIEKKMDRLCSLCFGKGKAMVGLDETVCLHGGTPELTGERSFYTVLKSTLPEKKNKYQELLMSPQASLTQCVKKKKQKTHEYSLTNPIVITIERFESQDLYLFKFAEPLSLNPFSIVEGNNDANQNNVTDTNASNSHENIDIVTSNVVGNNEFANKSIIQEIHASANVDMEAEDISNKAVLNLDDIGIQIVAENSALVEAHEKFDFTFSNPNSVICNDDFKVSEIPTTNEFPQVVNDQTTSNRNWIFDKCVKFENNATPTSETSLVYTMNNAGPKVQPCKVCWVFKHLDKCEACGKSNDIQQNVTYPVNIIQNPQIEAEVSYEYDAVKNMQDIKFVTWQCNICLTNNKNSKEMCDCCEAKPLSNSDRVNIAFGPKKTCFNEDNHTDDQIEKKEIQEVKLTNILDYIVLPDHKILFNTQNVEMNNNQMTINEATKAQQFLDNVINNNMIVLDQSTPMDTEIYETENMNTQNQPNTKQLIFLNRKEDAMDVQIPEIIHTEFSVLNTNTVHQVQNSAEIESNMTRNYSANVLQANMGNDINAFATNVTANQFQFNLGWTDKKPKNKKKMNKFRN